MIFQQLYLFFLSLSRSLAVVDIIFGKHFIQQMRWLFGMSCYVLSSLFEIPILIKCKRHRRQKCNQIVTQRISLAGFSCIFCVLTDNQLRINHFYTFCALLFLFLFWFWFDSCAIEGFFVCSRFQFKLERLAMSFEFTEWTSQFTNRIWIKCVT